MVQITWPRWPPCPYMLKTLKNLLLWNQKANDLETWYRVLDYYQVCSNDDPGLTLTYFTASSNFVPFAFVWEGKTMDFSETVVVYDIKVGRCSQLNEYMSTKGHGHLLTLCKSLRFNFFSSIIADFNISSALRWAIQDLWSFGFCMGKCLNCRFSRNYWSLWGEYRCTYIQINEYTTSYDNLMSRSFIDLFPRSLRFNIFELLFLKKF